MPQHSLAVGGFWGILLSVMLILLLGGLNFSESQLSQYTQECFQFLRGSDEVLQKLALVVAITTNLKRDKYSSDSDD